MMMIRDMRMEMIFTVGSSILEQNIIPSTIRLIEENALPNFVEALSSACKDRIHSILIISKTIM